MPTRKELIRHVANLPARQLVDDCLAARGREIIASLFESLNGSPVFAFEPNGELAWSSASARALFSRTLPGASPVEFFRTAVLSFMSDAAVESVDVTVGGLTARLLRARVDGSGDPFVFARLHAPPPSLDALLAQRFSLTRGERAVLHVLTGGKSNRQIAEELHLAIDTVRSHLKQVYAKMGVHTRAGVIVAVQTLLM